MRAQHYHKEVSRRLKQLNVFLGEAASMPKPTVDSPTGDVQLASETQPALQDFYTVDVETGLQTFVAPQ